MADASAVAVDLIAGVTGAGGGGAAGACFPRPTVRAARDRAAREKTPVSASRRVCMLPPREFTSSAFISSSFERSRIRLTGKLALIHRQREDGWE